MDNSVNCISTNQDLLNVRFEPLTVRCRHSQSRFHSVNAFLQWLVCWPDQYETSKFPVIWALGGMLVILVDMGSDLWVAKTHYSEGHFIWTYLTIAFFFLPMVFAQGYTVLIRRFQSWYQVHPIGPFYW
jgi:XK-related protein